LNLDGIGFTDSWHDRCDKVTKSEISSLKTC
jgi:hypothetical protein